VRVRIALVASSVLLASLGAPALVRGANLNVVDFIEYACPASIQTPTDLADAGGPRGLCAVAGRNGDFGTLDPGFSYDVEPIEFDLQASLHTSDSNVLTDPEASAGGVCDPVTKICSAYQNYAWFGVPSGGTTLVEDAPPPGFAFGWATVSIDGGPDQAGTVDAAASSFTFTTTDANQSAFVTVINITPVVASQPPSPEPSSSPTASHARATVLPTVPNTAGHQDGNEPPSRGIVVWLGALGLLAAGLVILARPQRRRE
jgi:hypothetical protein